jgi:hypothetical protein
MPERQMVLATVRLLNATSPKNHKFVEVEPFSRGESHIEVDKVFREFLHGICLDFVSEMSIPV